MSENNRSDMTFWQHLMELLTHLRTIIYSLIISTIIALLIPINLDFLKISLSDPFYPTIISFIIKDLQDRFLIEGVELLPISFLAPLVVYVQISFILGFIISLPVLSNELYKFFQPALYEREKKSLFIFSTSFILLFAFGLITGYFFVVPITMRSLFWFSDLLYLTPKYEFSAFFSLVGITLLLCGLLFTFPLFIIFLVKIGLIGTEWISKNRKYIYGGLVILIAIVDPDPSLITEILIFIPLVIITEISILISKRIEKSREQKNKQTNFLLSWGRKIASTIRERYNR